MKKGLFRILFILFLAAVFVSCAKRGTPEGGPVDEAPPKFVRAAPENFSINFDKKEIEIIFDEYIKLNDAQKQIIFSPPMDPPPAITPMGTASKSVKIEILDTLQPNTTYAINFGRSIVDNNEGNPLAFFQYVFSTGSYIDSLSVSGTVSNAYSKETDPFISVMLYEVDSTYNDSVVYKEPPRYITNTLDSSVTFQLNNLKAGTYQMIALKDVNNNYLFEPSLDKIGFFKEYVQIPNDSTFHLTLFKEELEFDIAPRPEQITQQHILFGYVGEVPKDSIQISLISSPPAGFEKRIVKDAETDTLHFWFKPNLEERDSLQFVVTAPAYSDTLISRISEKEIDSLQIRIEPSGTLNFNQVVKILPNIPIVQIDTTLLSLINQDTLPVPFTLEENKFKNEILLNFEKIESQSYTFKALPGAFTGFFGNVNDTLQAEFSTKAFSDYGNVTLNLENINSYPIIVQLTNVKGEVQSEKNLSEGNTVRFLHLKPGGFLIRVIYDANASGEWDTGNYLLERQPERVIYFQDTLDVRANWDIAQPFILP